LKELTYHILEKEKQIFPGSYLPHANFRRAKLDEADFRGSYLYGANFRGVN
jgi:uncharacterized protein YjbI with pentapeptide repeats